MLWKCWKCISVEKIFRHINSCVYIVTQCLQIPYTKPCLMTSTYWLASNQFCGNSSFYIFLSLKLLYNLVDLKHYFIIFHSAPNCPSLLLPVHPKLDHLAARVRKPRNKMLSKRFAFNRYTIIVHTKQGISSLQSGPKAV